MERSVHVKGVARRHLRLRRDPEIVDGERQPRRRGWCR